MQQLCCCFDMSSDNKTGEGTQSLARPLPVYSESGEDAVISRYFKYPKQGVYVDIGCNHPIEHNNTYLFYRLGWRGICVDANPMFAPLYAQNRPEDNFICCGVAANPGTLTFYRFDNGHAVSSFDKNHADFWVEASGGVNKYAEEPVAVRTINEILTTAGVQHIDVLSVDVEMLDAEVIISFDFKRWQPRVVAVEDHTMNMANPQSSAIFRHLSAHGYMFDSKTVDTSIYILPTYPFEKYKEEPYRAALAATK